VQGRRLLSNVLGIAGAALVAAPLLHRMNGAAAAEGAPIALPIETVPAAAIPPPPFANPPATPLRRKKISPRRAGGAAVPSGEAWGHIEIPRVGLDWVVVEGVGEVELRRGPGHVPNTAVPEASEGNCVIAGHRDSFFRSLSEVRRGDVVRVRGPDGRAASYRLEARRIVMPEEVSVMAPTPDRRLTLITCYPFGWIGDAPYRLVWSAAAVGETASSATADPAPNETPERTASTR
jgi:sortase A